MGSMLRIALVWRRAPCMPRHWLVLSAALFPLPLLPLWNAERVPHIQRIPAADGIPAEVWRNSSIMIDVLTAIAQRVWRDGLGHAPDTLAEVERDLAHALRLVEALEGARTQVLNVDTRSSERFLGVRRAQKGSLVG